MSLMGHQLSRGILIHTAAKPPTSDTKTAEQRDCQGPIVYAVRAKKEATNCGGLRLRLGRHICAALRSLAQLRHTRHVMVGSKPVAIRALFEGCRAGVVEDHRIADVVIAILYFHLLSRGRVERRRRPRRVVVASFWVLSLYRRRDR
jgi:hypothetical protein